VHNRLVGQQKIRVMQLINSFRRAGAEMVVFDLATRMDRETFEVFVCSIGRCSDEMEDGIRRELLSKDIVTLSLDKPPRRGRVRAMWKLYRFLSENRIDIVHTHCPSPDFYGKVGAFLARSPVVLSTIHNVQGYTALAERILGHLTSKYVAISGSVKRYAICDLLIPPAKVEVILNGIDLKGFSGIALDREAKLLELGIASTSKIVCTVGRVTEQKGHVHMIEAAQDVLSEFPNAHFLIVGDDHADLQLSSRLKQRVRANDLQDSITFTGVRADVAEILSVIDVFVLPSLWEGLCMALLEAMACAKPVIATRCGGPEEVVANGESGFLVPPGDAGVLGQRVKELLADPEGRRRLGMRAKATVKERFGVERMVREYEHLYLRHIEALEEPGVVRL